VSLGQWALVAVGAVVGGSLTSRAGISFWLAVPVVVALTAGIAVLIGLPALRIKGLFLLVSTFIFAIAVNSVLFNQRYAGWLLPESVNRPTLFFLNFEDEKSMYFLAVASLVLAIVVVGNLRRSRVGRLLIAMRENEANVQSFGVSALRAKLMAFAVSGGLAGFAGIIFAAQGRAVSPESFGADQNVLIFLQAVIGGVSSSGGALLGAAYFQVVQQLLASQQVVQTFLTAGGPLVILFIAPGGFISLVNAMRDSVLRVIAQRRRIVVPSLFADYDPDVLARQLIPLAEADPTSGLGALPLDERFVMASELYQGTGDRIVDRLEPAREGEERAALNAAASRSIEELDELEAAVAAGEQA
jgi:branched-chain amino acid transport system permease protein